MQRHLLRDKFVLAGYRPDGVASGNVLDLRTMKWRALREDGAPRFIDGNKIWSPQVIALDTRLVLFGGATYVLDTETNQWHAVAQPPDLGQTILSTVGDVLVTSTHRLDARALVYRPNSKGMQAGQRRAAWGGFFYQWSDGAPTGEKLDIRTGTVSTISLDGLKGFSTTAPPYPLGIGTFFVWGQTSGGKMAGALFDPAKEAWTSVSHGGGPDLYRMNLPNDNLVVGRFFVHHRYWYQDPLAPSDGAAKEQDTLYIFDGAKATWARVKTLKEAQVFPIGSWVLVIGGGKAWLHDPEKGGRCELSASRFGYGAGSPIQVLADGRRIVFFGNAIDSNPRCPPGAPCVVQHPELVRQSFGSIVATIAP